MKPKLILAAVLVFAFGATLGSQSATTKERWEYKIIYYNPLGMPLIDELGIAGGGGWEFVTVLDVGLTHQGTPGARNILMKRRL